MKNILFYLFFLGSLASFGKDLPPTPENCFAENVYCSNWEIINDSNNKRIIRINFFAQLPSDNFNSFQDIENLYMDFSSWPSYAEKSNSIKINLSHLTESGSDPDGNPFLSHEASYVIRGPSPVNWVKVKETTTYFKIPNVGSAQSSWVFDLKKDYPDLEGLKGKKGELHIGFDPEKNVYLVYVIVDVLPSISILQRMAAPYMESGFVSMFLGMFDLQ